MYSLSRVRSGNRHKRCLPPNIRHYWRSSRMHVIEHTKPISRTRTHLIPSALVLELQEHEVQAGLLTPHSLPLIGHLLMLPCGMRQHWVPARMRTVRSYLTITSARACAV